MDIDYIKSKLNKVANFLSRIDEINALENIEQNYDNHDNQSETSSNTNYSLENNVDPSDLQSAS